MQRTGMGSIGTAVTGAAFINDWSVRNGKVPMSFEVHCPNTPLDTLTLSLEFTKKERPKKSRIVYFLL